MVHGHIHCTHNLCATCVYWSIRLDFLVENKCKIDLEHNVMIVSGDSVEASLSKYPSGEPLRLARVVNAQRGNSSLYCH